MASVVFGHRSEDSVGYPRVNVIAIAVLLGCALLGLRFVGFRRRKTSHSK